MGTYTVIVDDNRTEWRNEKGELHRINGPAIEDFDGSKWWYLNGKRHRTDGPAIECAYGDKEWYYHGTEIICNNQKEFKKAVYLLSIS